MTVEIQNQFIQLMSSGNFAGVGRLAREYNLTDFKVDTYIDAAERFIIEK